MATPASDAPLRRALPTRQRAEMRPARRAALEAQRGQLLEQLESTDRALASLAEDRARIVAALADLRDELWPEAAWPQGRRPGRDSLAEPLPPLPERPVWLWGRQLRAVCLRLLARCGVLRLRRLHALLHLHGFGIAGGHPVKALADALGHEAEAGTAFRRARGRYGVTSRYRPPKAPSLYLADVELPELDE